MPILDIIIVILIAGVVAWLIGKAPFIEEPFKSAAKWIILAVVVLWLISIFAGWDVLNIRVGRRH